jgi:hypothetical protein
LKVCSYVYCYNPTNPIPRGICLNGGTGFASRLRFYTICFPKLFKNLFLKGIGALDGTPCYTENGLDLSVNICQFFKGFHSKINIFR